MSKYLLDDSELNKACVWAGGKYRLRREFLGGVIRLRKASDNSEIDIPDCGKGLCTTTIGKHLAVTIVNRMGLEGNFEGSNLSFWSSQDFATLTTEDKYYGNQCIKVIAANDGKYATRNFTVPTGNKVYCGGWIKKISGDALYSALRLRDVTTINNVVNIINNVNVNSAANWSYFSAEKVSVDGGVMMLISTANLQTVSYYLDGIFLIDKTAIWGAGNEPTQAELDAIVQSIGYFTTYEDAVTNGYITTLRDISREKYIKLINLLGVDGDCENLTGWTKALNQGAVLTNNRYTGSNAILLNGGASLSDAVYKDVPGNIGDRFYCCCYTKRVSGTGTAIMYLSDYQNFTNPSVVNVSTDTSYTFSSVIKTTTTAGTRVVLQCANNMSQVFDTIVCINLNSFGVGGEPTKAQLDNMLQKALQEGYFTEKNVIRPTDAITAAVSNQPKWVNGIKFDGLDDYFVIPNYPEIDFQNPPFSLVTVFTPPGAGSLGYLIAKNLDGVANMQYGIFVDYQSGQACTIYVQGAPFYITGVTTGVKTVLIFNIIGDKLFIYRDGALKGTFTGLQTTYTSRPNLFIGKRAINNVFYNNIIDEIMIFNKHLSEREIKKITKYFIGG